MSINENLIKQKLRKGMKTEKEKLTQQKEHGWIKFSDEIVRKLPYICKFQDTHLLNSNSCLRSPIKSRGKFFYVFLKEWPNDSKACKPNFIIPTINYSKAFSKCTVIIKM